ncbi:hypothetical protein [Shewanella electrodiphila]|nr:hypothetical protein [Shewanella electrodiphila]
MNTSQTMALEINLSWQMVLTLNLFLTLLRNNSVAIIDAYDYSK